MRQLLTDNFRAFSARIGADPAVHSGAGRQHLDQGHGVMWIKASGKELADAETARSSSPSTARPRSPRRRARATGPARRRCWTLRSARPSIETTFHAILDWRVVAHTHSVAVLSHVISPEGRAVAKSLLADLDPVFVPYAKPGLPLTVAIANASPRTRLILLENHGLIVCGETTAEVETLMEQVEARLRRDPVAPGATAPDAAPLPGFSWAGEENWLARDSTALARVTAGSYYPDHVVFLGPGLPTERQRRAAGRSWFPAIGIQIRDTATATQRAMLRCLSDVLRRVPVDWTPEPIGARRPRPNC
jgi:rhamnose utilization protein RhaD (predicted bifunctional aldolase and dehydrogenase)